jgi:hypothetical protein
LDPHYRTIEGFLLLIEKEWISFGHQFKHRLGKLTHKETSPVFLQFLDCVTQMISQFPSEFEYSIGFLEVLAKCTYSGYFSSFRQDCESQRNAELLSAISNFAIEFDSEDLNYTSVSSSSSSSSSSPPPPPPPPLPLLSSVLLLLSSPPPHPPAPHPRAPAPHVS